MDSKIRPSSVLWESVSPRDCQGSLIDTSNNRGSEGYWYKFIKGQCKTNDPRFANGRQQLKPSADHMLFVNGERRRYAREIKTGPNGYIATLDKVLGRVVREYGHVQFFIAEELKPQTFKSVISQNSFVESSGK